MALKLEEPPPEDGRVRLNELASPFVNVKTLLDNDAVISDYSTLWVEGGIIPSGCHW